MAVYLVAPLIALAEAGIPTDVQELLVKGDPMRGVAPGALEKAIRAHVGYLLSDNEQLAQLQSEIAELSEPHLCPVCAKPFKAGDQCSTDIELGMCHAECLEGCPTVNLDTGDPIDGPIPTYPYEADDAPQGETAELSLDAPLIERLERASAILANDDVTPRLTASRARRVFVTEAIIEAREKLMAPLPSPEATEADGIRKAIRFVERRRDAYVNEHGSYDPTTGVTEFPGNGDETVAEWEEIIEGLQALATATVGGR